MWILALAVTLSVVPAFSAESYLPLFQIERSLNANVVHYDAKVTNGHLDAKQPVIAYWIMATENGRRQELNLLERTRAYGFTTQRDGSDDSYVMHLVSDRHHDIHVIFKDGVARAETTIDGHPAYLQKIYVTTHKVMTMNITESAELQGIDMATGEPRREKVVAGK